ncbi:MAG: M15 family metallopeptidase [Oscillospiraceae bacterium]|nr:M15 family metallopeptidase [Oscillospiraceae bacterium]
MKNRRISYPRIFGVFALIIIFIFGFDSLKRNAAKKNAEDNLESIISVVTETSPPDIGQYTTETTSNKSIMVDNERYREIDKPSGDIEKGPLVLVNDEHKYNFPDISDSTSSIYDSMTAQHYKLSYPTHIAQNELLVKLNQMMDDFYTLYNTNDMTITSAYRTLDQQKELYEGTQSSYVTPEYMPQPGFSEHHTGYALDFTLVSSSGKITPYDASGDFAWVNSNCYKYGFLVRYPQDKTDKTGVDYQPWHFRYVGVPHSFIMNEQKLCLEEYIDYLKKYEFSKDHLRYSVYGYDYEIYYVPAQEGQTKVPIPVDRKYDISGNNVDGFIVTITEAGAELKTTTVPDPASSETGSVTQIPAGTSSSAVTSAASSTSY